MIKLSLEIVSKSCILDVMKILSKEVETNILYCQAIFLTTKIYLFIHQSFCCKKYVKNLKRKF